VLQIRTAISNLCILRPKLDLCNENQLDALFILNLCRQSTSTCFGRFIAHHQEVFTVCIQQLARVIRLGDWQLVGSGWNRQN
jgi:hypothetical protein